jgi:hypothetical protein
MSRGVTVPPLFDASVFPLRVLNPWVRRYRQRDPFVLRGVLLLAACTSLQGAGLQCETVEASEIDRIARQSALAVHPLDLPAAHFRKNLLFPCLVDPIRMPYLHERR